MTYIVKADNLADLERYWREKRYGLVWPCVFVLPPWLQSWWEIFGGENTLNLRAVWQDDKLIGIAPLRFKDSAAMFIGDVDVCDYQDFIVTNGRETDFFNTLLDDLTQRGIEQLELKHVRPESLTLKNLVPVASGRGYKINTVQEEVNVEMDLPSAWDVYVDSLSTKQRHEVRRKLRRLEESGEVKYHSAVDPVSVYSTMETFFKMFVESRRDKAAFLTGQREAFFTTITTNMAKAGMLKLGVLELDGKSVAQIICFDYNNCIYLYNSGYDPDYVSLSAGLMSKALAIKDSIESGRNKFDFLKGSEVYKFHLGGHEVPLYNCRITLKQ